MPRLLAILLGMFCVAAHAAYDALPSRPTDLSGRWVLNTALSDDPERMLMQRMAEERKRFEQWRRRQEEMRPPGEPEPIDIDGDRPAPDASAGDPSAPARRPAQRPWQKRRDENLRRMLAISNTLEITQDASRLQLVSEVDSRRFDAGSHTQVSMPQGELADSEVGWDGEWFIIERKVRGGPRAVEKLRLLPKTGQLEYYMAWSGDTELAGMKIRRIFDRASQPVAPTNPAMGPNR